MQHNAEWKLLSHNHQIADTGDYDVDYELTNGDIQLITRDDIDEECAEKLVGCLNELGAKWEDLTRDSVADSLNIASKQNACMGLLLKNLEIPDYIADKMAAGVCASDEDIRAIKIDITRSIVNGLFQG